MCVILISVTFPLFKWTKCPPPPTTEVLVAHDFVVLYVITLQSQVGFHTSFFTAIKSAPSVHLIGGGVGPRAGLDAFEKRKIYFCWEWDSSALLAQPII
jgi:hypothetical protein